MPLLPPKPVQPAKLTRQEKKIGAIAGTAVIVGVVLFIIVAGVLVASSPKTTLSTADASSKTSSSAQNNNGQANTPSSQSSQSTNATAKSNPASKQSPGLNQPADDGKFQFTVTGFSCGQSQLENGNEFETATAQGQFCVMKLTTKNIGNEAQEFDVSAQYVYTSDGKQLSYSSDGTIAANGQNSQCFSFPTVNPGNSLDCSVAFDVAKGVTPTYAMLHDSSFSGGVKVNLQ